MDIKNMQINGGNQLFQGKPKQSNSKLPELPMPKMTLREYYAGLAMQGLIQKMDDTTPFEVIARDAVNAADALIAELN